MDYLRGLVGLKAPASSEQAPGLQPPPSRNILQTKISQHENNPSRIAELADAQRKNLAGLRDEHAEQEELKRLAVQCKNLPVAKACIARQKELEAEIQQLEQVYKNTLGIQNRIAKGDAQLDQVLLMQQGAHVLEETAKALEQVQVEETVDKLREAGDAIDDHGRTLSEPIFGDVAVFDQEDVDRELEALMEEEAMRATANMPTMKVVPSVTPPTPNSSPQRRITSTTTK